MLRRKVARDGETSLVKTQLRYKPYALTEKSKNEEK